MKYILLFTAIILFTGLPKNIEKKVFKEIENTFEMEDFEIIGVSIDPAISKTLPSKFGKDNLFKIISNKIFYGYAYVSQAASKTALFDYLVLLDKDLVVVKTKVLIYREEYGGEIGSKRWLKQFIGKTQDDNLKYEQDIIAISGATISVRSFTESINNFLKSIQILHKRNIL